MKIGLTLNQADALREGLRTVGRMRYIVSKSTIEINGIVLHWDASELPGPDEDIRTRHEAAGTVKCITIELDDKWIRE